MNWCRKGVAEALQIEQHGHLAAGVGGEPDGVLSELIGQPVAIGRVGNDILN
jgi:hypothetical protein